jgi:hypothetical protein
MNESSPVIRVVSIDPEKKKLIRKINEKKLYYYEGYKFCLNGLFLNNYSFNEKEAITLTEHYTTLKFISNSERCIFFNYIDVGSNPFVDEDILGLLIENARFRSYKLNHTLLPEHIAYFSFDKDDKQKVDYDDLKKYWEDVQLVLINAIEDEENRNKQLKSLEKPIFPEFTNDVDIGNVSSNPMKFIKYKQWFFDVMNYFEKLKTKYPFKIRFEIKATYIKVHFWKIWLNSEKKETYLFSTRYNRKKDFDKGLFSFFVK